jgi:hypothetical protein
MSRTEIKILDSQSTPGNPAKPNDDRFGHNEASAFVIDGATGLGDRQYIDASGSDAAWIAARFADGFRQHITRDSAISDIARVISTDAKAYFLGSHPDVPRYAWPLSAFAMLHSTHTGFTFYGLGDSCIFVLNEDGTASIHTAIPDAYTREQAHAQSHIARTGGITKGGGALGDTQTLAALRKHRETQNTPAASGRSGSCRKRPIISCRKTCRSRARHTPSSAATALPIWWFCTELMMQQAWCAQHSPKASAR